MATPHFSDAELGIVGCEERIIANFNALCSLILEPLRKHFGEVVHVHDGYRDDAHNARVGGKLTSYHRAFGGEAAVDIDVDQIAYEVVFDWLRLESGLPFDKVILEQKMGVPRCVHIQYDRLLKPRRKAYMGETGDAKSYTEFSVVPPIRETSS